MVAEWKKRKVCTRKELESLIGILQHACTVIPPGRSFLRRAISLLSVVKQRHHHIRLNTEFRSDLMWWKAFAPHWNGASLIIHQESREICMASDASGSWGCGAWCGSSWFQYRWEDSSHHLNIATKELLPILIAGAIWGHEWQGCTVKTFCDNAAVVAVVNSRYSKDKNLMHLLRCLFFIEAQFQFRLSAAHIPGVHNSLVDDLSRNKLSAFKENMKTANDSPSIIPLPLLQGLLHTKLDWTQLFVTSVNRV